MSATYTQVYTARRRSTKLEALAKQTPDGIHVAEFVAQDLDLITRMSVEPSAGGFRLGGLADGQRDLLERQLQILLKALVPDGAAAEKRLGGRLAGSLPALEG